LTCIQHLILAEWLQHANVELKKRLKMALRKFKPITAGTRWRIGNAYAEVTTNVPEHTLVESKKRTGGRNSSGHLSMRYRGGGHKKKYRIVDLNVIKKRNESIIDRIRSEPYGIHRFGGIY
jgi:large subunit ribosomal protein L2